MKKFFTRRVPIEAELKVGNVTLWPSDDDGYYSGKLCPVAPGNILHLSCLKCKPWEVHLCSREIEPGDLVWSDELETRVLGKVTAIEGTEIVLDTSVRIDIKNGIKVFKIIRQLNLTEKLMYSDNHEFDEDPFPKDHYATRKFFIVMILLLYVVLSFFLALIPGGLSLTVRASLVFVTGFSILLIILFTRLKKPNSVKIQQTN